LVGLHLFSDQGSGTRAIPALTARFVVAARQLPGQPLREDLGRPEGFRGIFSAVEQVAFHLGQHVRTPLRGDAESLQVGRSTVYRTLARAKAQAAGAGPGEG